MLPTIRNLLQKCTERIWMKHRPREAQKTISGFPVLRLVIIVMHGVRLGTRYLSSWGSLGSGSREFYL